MALRSELKERSGESETGAEDERGAKGVVEDSGDSGCHWRDNEA